MAIIFGICGVIFLFCLPTSGAARMRTFFFLCSAALFGGPFLLVQPVTARCFFASYVMLAMLAIELIVCANAQSVLSRRLLNAGRVVCVAALVVLFAHLLRVFYANHVCAQIPHEKGGAGLLQRRKLRSQSCAALHRICLARRSRPV